MPYIGAVVLYLVLQSLAGEPQLSFAENARPENPVTVTSWDYNFFSHYVAQHYNLDADRILRIVLIYAQICILNIKRYCGLLTALERYNTV